MTDRVSLDFNVGPAAAMIEASAENAVQVLAQGVYLLAETALTLAKEAAPVRTGFLRSTHWAGDPIVQNGKIVVHLGAWASYATVVHELSRTHAQWFANAAYTVASTAEERFAAWMAAQTA